MMTSEAKKLQQATSSIDARRNLNDPLGGCSLLSAPSAKSPERSTALCKCGAPIEVVRVGPLCLTPAACPVCERESKEAGARAAARGCRERKRQTLRARIEAVVPPHFQRAHWRHVPKALRPMISDVMGGENGRGLLLWGPVGGGKSYTLCAMARHWVIRGESVVRYRYDSLLLDIRRTYNRQGGESDADIIDRCTRADRLLLDDIGSGTSLDTAESDFAIKTLCTILDTRIEAEKPTYFTSNKPLEILQTSFDERIASRIEGACEIVKLDAPDWRRTQ